MILHLEHDRGVRYDKLVESVSILGIGTFCVARCNALLWSPCILGWHSACIQIESDDSLLLENERCPTGSMSAQGAMISCITAMLLSLLRPSRPRNALASNPLLHHRWSVVASGLLADQFL
jgi:hypothetical protein